MSGINFTTTCANSVQTHLTKQELLNEIIANIAQETTGLYFEQEKTSCKKLIAWTPLSKQNSFS